MGSRLAILLFIVLASPTIGQGFGEGRNLSDCAENFDTLEWALVHSKHNKVELRNAFYPPRGRPSHFVTVHYKFLDEDGMNTTCKKTWLWSTIGFYLIQPPSIHQFMALFFNPEPRDSTANILLPNECRDLVTWKNGSCSCVSNGMLDIITQQLKLYAQFNNPDNIKIDDTLLALAVCDDNHEEEYNNAEKIVTFLSCGLVIPITFTLVLILLLRSIREPTRVAITKPKNHAYLVALALTGMIFTGFVLVMDMCALVFTVEGRHEFIMHTSIRKEYSLLFVVITTALDALPMLHSCIVVVYLRILACTCCETNHNFLRNYFEVCLYPIFGKIKIKGATEDHGEEFKVWLVTTLCFAPLFCIASHSGYIVVSWVADTEHATSITLLYILSFLYYFIIFRHLYTVFGDIKPACPEAYLIAILFLKLYNWLCFACNCFWCCSCRFWGNNSNVDLPNEICKVCSFLFCICYKCYTCCLKRYQHERDTCRGKCYNCCEVYENQLEEDMEDQELVSPISAQNDRINKHSKAPLNLPAFFIGIWIGIFLSSVEAVIILGFALIPVTLDKAPIDIYRVIQLVFIVLTTLITYKFFNVGEGPKKIMQAFVQKISDLRTSSDELSKLEENEAAGRVIGEVAHTIIKLLPQQPPPSGQAANLESLPHATS